MIKNLIEVYKKEYLKISVENVIHNKHMNNLTEANFSVTDVEKMLDTFTEKVPLPNSNMIIHILTSLTEHAKEERKNLISETNFDPDIVEAVIVDFINYVGMINGVDYALYTSDLKNK